MIDALSSLTWSLDGWIVVVGALVGFACAPLGCFLVLRRMSMMGDAISHAVLPGLAVAFLVSGSRESWPMFVGAAGVGLLTAVFTEFIRDRGQVDEGASMGVVFTALFALGLVLMVQAADSVDIDPGCVLYGLMEFTPLDTVGFLGVEVPRVARTLALVGLINLGFVGLFFKELKISSFDPSLSNTLGISSRWMHYALMTLVAITAVASFEAVGNILVVAVLIVPAATASLLTDRLAPMLWVSLVVAVLGAVLGHLGAVAVPAAFGLGSVSSAGAMATALGGLLAAAALLAPRHGMLGRWMAARAVGWKVRSEDALAQLFRAEEARESRGVDSRPNLSGAVLRRLVRRGLLEADSPMRPRLTGAGRSAAEAIVRRHRLWESWLDQHTTLPADHLHASAERLEHANPAGLFERLRSEAGNPKVDPHGSAIPGPEPSAPDRSAEG